MPVIDLFCGCGGLSLGFERNNFDIVASFDNWNSAVTCYNNNFDHPAICSDLSNTKEITRLIAPYNPDLIIGGPPCQEFSNAGKRTEGEKANLTIAFSKIIGTILPNYFVMENVPRAIRSKAFEQARKNFKDAGYGLSEVILDASRCGVPQKRSRFFCVGALNAPNGFLLGNIFNSYIGKPISFYEYFQRHNYELNITAYYRHPTTYKRRAVFSVHETAPTVRGINRPKPKNYKLHPNDVVAEADIKNIRCLSLTERARIQTFPPTFYFDQTELTKGDLDQMIGNAVPVELAVFIASRLRDYMEGVRMEKDTQFVLWLRENKKYTDRTISDIFSRINRARSFLPDRNFDRYFIVDLEANTEFATLSKDVQSQIRSAVRLKQTFIKVQN